MVTRSHLSGDYLQRSLQNVESQGQTYPWDHFLKYNKRLRIFCKPVCNLQTSSHFFNLSVSRLKKADLINTNVTLTWRSQSNRAVFPGINWKGRRFSSAIIAKFWKDGACSCEREGATLVGKLKVTAAQSFCGMASQFPDHWPKLPACHIMTILKIQVLQVIDSCVELYP